MQQRIYGIETEYAVGVETSDGRIQAFDPGEVFKYLERYILKNYTALKANSFGRNSSEGVSGIEIKEGFFIESGARVYYDTGHAEWSTPEAATAREAVLYEMAGERTLSELAQSLYYPNGRFFLIKNNVDYSQGTTYGCHENYLVKRDPNARKDRKFFDRLVEQLVPFLVTRQIFCGAGKIGSRTDDYGGYQISQRADFIECLTSKETRSERAIINERDESLLNNTSYRRLHLIVGDSNMSPYAAVLKLGSAGIVLRLIEEEVLTDPPLLKDPVQAIKDVSRDLTCRQTIPLKKGDSITPIELQRWYLTQALRFFEVHDIDQPTKDILDMWQQILDDLSIEPLRTADRIDWVSKLRYLLNPALDKAETSWEEVAAWSPLITQLRQEKGGRPSKEQYARYQRYLTQHQLNWNDYETQQRLYFNLRERDLRYHDVDPQRGLFHYLCQQGIIKQVFQSPEIETAKRTPPQDTRARARADIIYWAHKEKIENQTTLDWGQIQLPIYSHPIFLDDPFSTTFPGLSRKLEPVPLEEHAQDLEDEIEISIVEDIPKKDEDISKPGIVAKIKEVSRKLFHNR